MKKSFGSMGMLEIAGLVAGALILNKFLKGHFGYYAATGTSPSNGTSSTTALVPTAPAPAVPAATASSLVKTGAGYDTVTLPPSTGNYVGSVTDGSGSSIPVVQSLVPVAQSPVSTGNDIIGASSLTSPIFTNDYF